MENNEKKQAPTLIKLEKFTSLKALDRSSQQHIRGGKLRSSIVSLCHTPEIEPGKLS